MLVVVPMELPGKKLIAINRLLKKNPLPVVQLLLLLVYICCLILVHFYFLALFR